MRLSNMGQLLRDSGGCDFADHAMPAGSMRRLRC